ncbi:MAG TPA: Os1348 family NHLP clan protein [Acidimicrobiia bacterium]|nr:Os1348 family NHLP clan protein [Acidimicrobiia bacterium]
MAVEPDSELPIGFSYLVGKAAFDPEFASALAENPPQALRSIGIEPTEEMLEALRRIDTDAIMDLAAAFDDKRGVV